jgi:uncharacterized membrane protein
MPHTRVLRTLTRADAHHRQFIALILGATVFLLAQELLPGSTHLIAAWDAYAIADLALAWGIIVSVHPEEVRKMVRLQDSSRTMISSIVILAACSSLLAVGLVLRPARGTATEQAFPHLILSIVAVVSSWALVHTVFTLRYAHIYYGEAEEPHREGHEGGLEFPGGRRPDVLDFAYFSFVVGMTCQVSDVPVTSRRMRRLTLLHGLLSFGFNTVILALTISAVAGVL